MTVIREFRWPDIPAAVQIERANFPHDTWSAESFWNELAGVGHDGLYVVAVDADELVGYAGIVYIAPDAHVQSVSVAQSAQGQGIGKLLVERLLEFADEKNAQRCLLEVRLDNTAARRLYAGYGFEELGVRKGYYPGGEDALVLARSLGRSEEGGKP